VRDDLWYFWTAPVYLLLYWMVRSASRLELPSTTGKD